MALETGTYFADLNSSNPTAGDPKAQGDDHTRLLKAAGIATCPIAAPVYPLTSGTAQAATSGTAIDFTSIPSWVKRISVQFVGVSTNGADNLLIQLGDSGGIESAGYETTTCTASGTTVSLAMSTAGFNVGFASAAAVMNGKVVFELHNSSNNTWEGDGCVGNRNTAQMCWTAGYKSTSAALDRIRITTTGGTNTFDTGSINVLYE